MWMQGTAQIARAWDLFCPPSLFLAKAGTRYNNTEHSFSFPSLSLFDFLFFDSEFRAVFCLSKGQTRDVGLTNREYRDQILGSSGHSIKVCWKNRDWNGSDFRFKSGHHRTIIKQLDLRYIIFVTLLYVISEYVHYIYYIIQYLCTHIIIICG